MGSNEGGNRLPMHLGEPWESSLRRLERVKVSQNVLTGQEKESFYPSLTHLEPQTEKEKNFIAVKSWEDCSVDSWGNWVPESTFLIVPVLISIIWESKICVFWSPCLCVSHSMTQFLGAPRVLSKASWAQGEFPRLWWRCLTEEGRSFGRAEGSSGTQLPTRIHFRPSAAMPGVCQGCYQSPLPSTYDEAAWGILSLEMHFRFHSHRQVRFVL